VEAGRVGVGREGAGSPLWGSAAACDGPPAAAALPSAWPLPPPLASQLHVQSRRRRRRRLHVAAACRGCRGRRRRRLSPVHRRLAPVDHPSSSPSPPPPQPVAPRARVPGGGTPAAHLLRVYLGSRVRFSVFGRWNTTLWRGFRDLAQLFFFTAAAALAAVALASLPAWGREGREGRGGGGRGARRSGARSRPRLRASTGLVGAQEASARAGGARGAPRRWAPLPAAHLLQCTPRPGGGPLARAGRTGA
jgi:hypothetical protein